MGLRNRWHCTPNVTIYEDVDNVLEQISFSKIEEAYNARKEEKESDPDTFKKYERHNRSDSQVEIDIDPDEYDLMSIDEESLDDFDLEDIIDAVENSGYIVLKKGTLPADINAMTRYIGDLSNWKFKDILCDILGLNHLASKEDIINEVKNKL